MQRYYHCADHEISDLFKSRLYVASLSALSKYQIVACAGERMAGWEEVSSQLQPLSRLPRPTSAGLSRRAT